MTIRTFFAGLMMWAAMVSSGFSADDLVGKPIPSYSLTDQHGVAHSLAPETRNVVLCFEMKLSKSLHQWLAEQDPDYLDQHKTEYVADISKMPRIITKLFAGPKMRRYPFRILWAKEKTFADSYPTESQKITVLQLDANQMVTAVNFVATPEELMAIVDPEGFAATQNPDGDKTAQ